MQNTLSDIRHQFWQILKRNNATMNLSKAFQIFMHMAPSDIILIDFHVEKNPDAGGKSYHSTHVYTRQMETIHGGIHGHSLSSASSSAVCEYLVIC